MSHNLIKLTGCLIIGLLIGCSGSDGDPPSRLVVVTAENSNNGNPSTDTNTNATTTTGLNTGSEIGDTGTTTTGTDDSGITTGGSQTAGTTTGAVTGGPDTTTGAVTTGPTDGTGTTIGTVTATAGTTAGSDTDAGLDSAGTAGTTTGDGGTTTGAGTTTTGTTDYPIGSLASVLNNDPELTSAFKALQDANLDLAIDNPDNEFTLFLPNNDAFEDLASPSDFVLRGHTVSGAVSSATLAALNGRGLLMDDGQRLIVEGGGAEPLTIADAELTSVDIMGNASATVVHIIDAVIDEVEEPTSPYVPGSLQDVLFKMGDMMNVLSTFEENGLELAFDQPFVEWTVFLPNDGALEDPDDFRVLAHIYNTAALDSTDLTGLIGSELLMVAGNQVEIGGGGTAPLTADGYTIVKSDVQNESNTGLIVHVIDGLLLSE